MKQYQLLLFVCCILMGQTSFSQTPSITTDSIVLNITVTTMEGAKLKTRVNFENLANHTIKSCNSNAEGKAQCVLISGYNYKVTIPNSTDHYAYEIPDFSFSPLALTLKFGLTKANKSQIGIELLDGTAVTAVSLTSKFDTLVLTPDNNHTVYAELEDGKEYAIRLNNVDIKQNKVLVGNGILQYVLHFTDATHAQLTPVGSKQAVMHIIRKNLEGIPVVNDLVKIQSSLAKLTYTIKTGANGTAVILVPTGDQYKFSLTYYPDVLNLVAINDTISITTNHVQLKFPSTKEYEIHKKEELARIAKRDSLYSLYEKSKELSKDRLFSSLEDEVKKHMDKLAKDPHYFEKELDVVNAVLLRNKNRWNSKMIVTDVTGSMYPYIKQIALWHQLELMDKHVSDYVFFNDGDSKSDFQKVIGKTGGIYFNHDSSAQSVADAMYSAMKNGTGGDAPENDIEALLATINRSSAKSQIILIADNYSPIKDMELLDSLTKPVHVILCGTLLAPINADCLRLAYKTGGSIHTIEQDIMNLALLHDNEIITIGDHEYRMLGGYFFPVKTT